MCQNYYTETIAHTCRWGICGRENDGVNKIMLSHASMYDVGLDGPIDGDILTASTTSHMGEKNKTFIQLINFFFKDYTHKCYMHSNLLDFFNNITLNN
ncbi:hypothetical protein WN943_028422 [Citrus x changshan-huyou]